MGEETQIKHLFPKLEDDVDFKVTSPQTPDYNCIAWAYHHNDRWMWPGGQEFKNCDGFHYWPDGVEDSTDVSAFIKAFEKTGYSLCEDCSFEKGYRKIALYVEKGTTECTHAARQLSNGKWTSKLGQLNDIQHGTPYTIEGDLYGEVYCIMKREHR